MLGLYVSVPVACFRKGLAREYLETEPLPPPATCYGFLLSLVGETNRRSHVGCRVSAVLLTKPSTSVVLRTVWRCKDKNYWTDPTGRQHLVSTDAKVRSKFEKWVESNGWPKPTFSVGLGSGTNARPDYQQLLTDVQLLIWLDSSQETCDRLEDRVQRALDTPSSVSRFGGLSLGESTHLVDEVLAWENAKDRVKQKVGRAFLTTPRGRLTLPVWVDHVGSANTRYATGDLVEGPLEPPPVDRLPTIVPPEGLP